MPTFRKDIHLGHDVAQIDTDDIADRAFTEEKMADGSVSERALKNGAVTEPKLADGAVSNRTIQDKAITEPKLADDSVSHRAIQPNAVEGDNVKPGSIENRHLANGSVTPEKLSPSVKSGWLFPNIKEWYDINVKPIIDKLFSNDNSIDRKYTAITNELYSMIRSLQVGGIALSQKFGNREDIGISQKTLTKTIGRIWEELGTITGKTYMDFTLTVQPHTISKEGTATVSVTVDCSDSISDFDLLQIFVNNEIVAETSDVSVYNMQIDISSDGTSVVKAIGTILGKPIIKEESVKKYFPFFMGSGNVYTDIMNEECQKELHGTLEGDYDIVVKNTNDYIFIIIPISHKDEFRRAKLDMNGFEIPLDVTEASDYIICQTLNRYKAGTYNIDIDIND